MFCRYVSSTCNTGDTLEVQLICEINMIYLAPLLTLSCFGVLQARRYKSGAARRTRRNMRSSEGPISSSSTRGVLEPDFLNWILVWGYGNETYVHHTHTHTHTHTQHSVPTHSLVISEVYFALNCSYGDHMIQSSEVEPNNILTSKQVCMQENANKTTKALLQNWNPCLNTCWCLGG